jgi:DMSO reductase family type II enzyme chaperone
MSAPSNMPTPFETRDTDTPPRSIFRNYGGTDPVIAEVELNPSDLNHSGPSPEPRIATSLPHPGLCRSFLYRFMAQVFDYPEAEPWTWLSASETHDTVNVAVAQLAASDGPELPQLAGAALAVLSTESLPRCADDYIAAFGHGARGSCPINEIEYGDLSADPLFQPHRLADLAAFYHAFGMEPSRDGGERQDHLSVELEFMSVLAFRDAVAAHDSWNRDAIAQNQHAQKTFLREHLARWTPAFARQVQKVLPHSPWAVFAALLHRFVESECRRFDIRAGSEELLLRPIDEAAESLCLSCGGLNPHGSPS